MKYVISDLHLNDKSKGDDFRGNEQRLSDFVSGIPGRSIILNGDIFDLWETSLEIIERRYGDLIKQLFEKTLYYVLGNHDRDFPHAEYQGVPVVRKLVLGDTLIMHGHLFDLANKDGHVLGNIVTRIVGWIERHVDPDMDQHATRIEMWLRKQGRFGTPAVYREKALAFIDGAVIDGRRIKRVVLGHTHKKDHAMKGDLEYLNTGTWTNGKTDFGVLEDR